MLPQDLHIHTVYSKTDRQVVPHQRIDTVAFARHAKITGISDHFEMFMPDEWENYRDEVRKFNLLLGTEVNGHANVKDAASYKFDYYIYHCWGHEKKDYLGYEELCETGKPVVIAHPYAIGTDLNKLAEGSLVEINNRYIWRYDWRKEIGPFVNKFRWIFSSDAHQPNWLNQTMARRVGEELKIKETILF